MTEASEPVPYARTSFVHRMVGAATLHVPTYEEIEHDRSATLQAALVVFLAALASAFGSSRFDLLGVLDKLANAYFQWVAWAVITWAVGTKIFEGTADLGEMLRTLGFCFAPGLLYILGAIPILDYFIRTVIFLWIAVAAVVAVRQALDVSTEKALGTVLAGVAVYIILEFVRLSLF
jgi:hypothetical protein